MLKERIANLTSPVARELLSGLVEEMQECIFVPDRLIEERYRTNGKSEYVFERGREYGQSLAALEKRIAAKRREESVLTYQQEKENRISEYCNRSEENVIQYIEDEDRLYRAQVAFCKLALPADTFED
jgi:hypothetical protein